MKNQLPFSINHDFEVKDSVASLSAITAACIIFGILFSFFVDPNQAGLVYWTIIFCALVSACVFIFKIFTSKAHLLINRKGIYFSQKDLFLRWKNIARAKIVNIKEEIEEEDFRLLVHYYEHKTGLLKITTFKTTAIMNRSDADIENAIAFYSKGKIA